MYNGGGDSGIYCELLLFKYAYKMGYDYYHLLSGVCMPIKSQKYIHDFFEGHNGFEFIGLVPNSDVEMRLMYYHFFISRESSEDFWSLAKRSIHIRLLMIQKKLHIKRSNKEWNILAKGANWCSLTHTAVQYILSKERTIRKRFIHTLACDEVYKQTLLMNSPFANHIFNENDEYGSCMRLIDWTRGKPYVWTMDDWRELMDSDKLFARKFSSQHMDLVDRLTKRLKEEQC